MTCLTAGGGIGADCNGYPDNAFRYDTPTWGGFSVSTSYGEDDMWDVAVKYAADWNSVKFSAAAGYTQVTDEGCRALARSYGRTAPTSHCWVAVERLTRTSAGMRISSRSARPSCTFHQACSFMACIRAEQNDGTQWKTINFNTGKIVDSAANETDVWYVKAGIKRAWSPVGATVLFGEWGQYNDMFTGLCGIRALGLSGNIFQCGALFAPPACRSAPCRTAMPIWLSAHGDRFGSRAVGPRCRTRDRLCGDASLCPLAAPRPRPGCDRHSSHCDQRQRRCSHNKNFGKSLNTSFEGLDLFQIGGVIFF